MENCCRICLTHSEDDMITVHFTEETTQKTYFQMYESISGLQPLGRPEYLCEGCAEALKTAFLFKETLQQNEKLFSDDDVDPAEMIVVGNKGERPTTTNEEEELIQCVLCPYKTYKKHNYQKHISRNHKKQKMKCDGCDQMFHLIYVLQKHRKLQHGFDYGYEVDEYEIGPEPEIKVEEPTMIECPLCDYKNAIKDNYSKHVKRVHNRQSLQCDGCEEKFHLVYVLDEHRKRRHGFYHRYVVDESLRITHVAKKRKTVGSTDDQDDF